MAAHAQRRHRGWDHPLGQNSIGVAYTYKNEDHQMHQLGTEDRAALRRLERAGKLTYADDDVRERYQTMERGEAIRPHACRPMPRW
jgi:hypothetical protein